MKDSNQVLNNTHDSAINLANEADAGPTLFPIILCVIYSICKFNQLYNIFNESITYFKDLIGDLVILRKYYTNFK
jgi:hypothetical protein